MKRMITAVLTAATLSFAGIGACDWVESGQMLRYPAKTWFYAVGSGNSTEAATTSSIIEVRKQLASKVETKQFLAEYDSYDGETSEYSSTYEEQTTLSMKGEVQGVEVISTCEVDGMFYAFAALKKDDFAANTKVRVHELMAELEKVFGKAKSEIGAGNVSKGLVTLAEARQIFERLDATRKLLSAAVKLSEKEKLTITLSDINDLYAESLLSLSTEISGGNKQKITAGMIPEEPFEVKISAKGVGVPNIPFSLKDKSGRKIMKAYSDREGIVSFYLGEKADSEKGTYRFSVEPRIKVAKQHKGKIKGLTQKFAYKVESNPSYANISVTIQSDLRSKSSLIKKKAHKVLGKYDIMDDNCSCRRLTVEITATKGEYIQGVSAERTFQKSTVNALFTLKNRKGKTLNTFSKSATGLGGDYPSSVAKGVEALRLKDAAKELKKILNTPEDKPKVAKISTKKPKIIVFPFKNSEYIANWHDLAEALSGMITTKLINSGRVVILERAEIARLVDEKNFRGQDIDLAKFVGADLAIFGTASLSGGKIEVDARLVDVNTAVSKAAVSTTGYSLRDLRSISNSLVSKIKVNGVPLGKPIVQPKSDCCK